MSSMLSYLHAAIKSCLYPLLDKIKTLSLLRIVVNCFSCTWFRKQAARTNCSFYKSILFETLLLDTCTCHSRNSLCPLLSFKKIHWPTFLAIPLLNHQRIIHGFIEHLLEVTVYLTPYILFTITLLPDTFSLFITCTLGPPCLTAWFHIYKIILQTHGLNKFSFTNNPNYTGYMTIITSHSTSVSSDLKAYCRSM